ncbi:hypothetical protein J5N97_023282 [Dioscorea zingiberensis]|uniref:Protein kinase domain-containing protein n=1 Tax=Dioscorea zingiberensis TaxID=325984 RepID=A0A9D5CDT2_9LILI|nr:hypothetical protein J5N97_023282 [Dioscorea zingiberensis]
MPLLIVLVLCVFFFASPCSGIVIAPSNSPLAMPEPPRAQNMRPIHSPRRHNVSSSLSKYHHSAPPQSQDCEGMSCSNPLTLTPIGSPCACVYPVQVEIDLGVAPYQLFTMIPELEIEVAAGTYLKQSQIRIMGASPSTRNPEKTAVTIDLVPLGGKFDNMTAFLIYERFWQKKVPINVSLFGDYNVIYVLYPGLPSSPPMSGVSSGPVPSTIGSHENPLSANVPPRKRHSMIPATSGIIVFSLCTFALICFVMSFVLWKLKSIGRSQSAVAAAITAPSSKKDGVRSIASPSVTRSTSRSFAHNVTTFPSSVKTFSLTEIERATDTFSSQKVLGEGGFGIVYHGVMEDGSEVAVKLLTRKDHNGHREFIAEIEMLSRLHHRNLVKLIGICIEGHVRCLVFELISNGSVESHLHGADKWKGILDWDARLKIALGAARALAYLHEDSNPCIIHRDFKASNVLLEDDFTPKVSDFGLAREASEGSRHISTKVMGTFGYVAPEYAMTGHLLVKSDVYSYGVVLVELLSGRKPVDMSQPQGSENLVTWARPLLTSKEGLQKLVDPSLDGKFDFDNMAKVAAIASMCVHLEASQRPFMGEVVQALKLICNSMDENNESSFAAEHESSSWNGGTPQLNYGFTPSSFSSMEYVSDPLGDLQRVSRSGPLRTKRKRSAFQRLRGSMSEHEFLSRRFGRKRNLV